MIDSNNIITKSSILNKVSESNIFKKYLGIIPALGISYKNPLRDDDHTGCKFYYDNRGTLKFKDFSTGWNWDCFNVVQYKYNINFGEALKLIASDFNLGEVYPNRQLIERNSKKLFISNVKTKTKISVSYRKWFKADLDYWKKYYIDLKTLNVFNVTPISKVWINDKLIYQTSLNDPCYCYHFRKGDMKLYFPLRNKGENKFIHLKSNIIQGFDQLPLNGEILIITKSYKDVMCISLFNYPAIAPMSETNIIDKSNILNLKSRFNYIYTLFDNDETGINLGNKMKELYEIPPLFFPLSLEKDFSDNLKTYGVHFMNKLINLFKKYHNGNK